MCYWSYSSSKSEEVNQFSSTQKLPSEKKMAACEKNRTIIEDLESCNNVCSEVHTFSDWVKEEEKNMARFRFSFPPGLSSHSGIWESKVKNY